ncbi:MAG TPA: hypothetical protein PLL77_03300 [Pyrinomonadaceae bacterium]|nr:hypothetical protein [Pyrinomonadaceae bacterium]
MKRCPQCNHGYSDETLNYCLLDGALLISDPIGFQMSDEVPTQVINRSTNPTFPTAPSVATQTSKWVFPLVGVLCGLVVVLGFFAFFRESSSGKAALPQKNAEVGESNKNIESQRLTQVESNTLPTLAESPSPNNSSKSAKTLAAQSAATFNPTGRWKGEWSTASGTLFDFELNLSDTGSDKIEGQIRWTMRRTARPDKTDKIGLSATEFVRGSADPTNHTINLTGYSKNDPNNVLVMVDVYKLTVSPDGKSLVGSARNGGKWNGRVNLRR